MAKRVTRQALQVLSLHPDQQEVEPLDLQIILPPFVRGNWRQDMEVETAWGTTIEHGGSTLVEDRLGLRTRPTRSMRTLLTGTDGEKSNAVLEFFLSLGQDRNSVPLYTDRTISTAQASSGQKIVQCDTSYRRLYAGQRVAFVPGDFSTFSFSGIEGRAMYGEVASVEIDRITLKEDLEITLPAATYVYPMIDVNLALDNQLTVITGDLVEGVFSCFEIAGMSALPASWVGGVSALFPVNDLDNRAIVSLRNNFGQAQQSVKILREGRTAYSGNGASVYGAGARPRFIFDFEALSTSREHAWSILRLFDSLRGRVGLVWYTNPHAVWSAPYGLTSIDYIDVNPYGYSQNITKFFDNASIELLDGSYYVRGIESVTEVPSGSGVVYRLTFSDPLPSTISSPLKRITSAHLSRLTSDALTERWRTMEMCQFKLSFIESLDEGGVVFSGI